MINFFRKIRQKLLTENKLSKYLIYAIGEILLVMIGILLALQVNNWNEQRKLNLNEHALYKKLVLDLTSEELSLKGQISWARRIQDLHYIIYNKTKGKFNSDSNISYNNLQYTFTYRPKIKEKED